MLHRTDGNRTWGGPLTNRSDDGNRELGLHRCECAFHFFLHTHGCVTKAHFKLVTVIKHLWTRYNLENAPRELFPEGFVSRGEMFKGFANDILLIRELLVIRQVLPRTTATFAKMRATRRDFVYRFTEDFDHLSLGIGVLLLRNNNKHLLTRNRSRDKHR